MPQRNVTITDRQDRFVEAMLETGQFGNVSEIFRAGLRLLEHEEQERILRNDAINKGIEDYKDGRYIVLDGKDEVNAYFDNKRKKRMERISKG